MSSHITAIFFDLDGTLRHSVPEGGEVLTAYVASLGLAVTAEDRRRGLRWEHQYWANSADLRDDLLAHSADTEKFWVEYSRRHLLALGATPAWADAHAAQTSAHMGEMYKPESIVPEDVRRALPQLQAAGYRMAVISNRDKPFLELLDSHHLREFFPYALAAGEVQIYKPDPGVFEHALRQVQVTAAETVYVGDNYYADVIGARRAGLVPVLYDPNRIFPAADCLVIHAMDELLSVVQGL